MNNEERLRSCGFCEFLSYPIVVEPCKTCLHSHYHPNFQPQKHSRKEEKEDKRTCMNCVRAYRATDEDICKSCLVVFKASNVLINWEERKPDEHGNSVCDKSKRTAILTEANNIVSGNRKAGEYGQPEDSFGVIAGLWSEYLDQKIKPHDVAVMMVLLKIARIKGGEYKLDNWIDLAGYAACGGECQAKEEGCW